MVKETEPEERETSGSKSFCAKDGVGGSELVKPILCCRAYLVSLEQISGPPLFPFRMLLGRMQSRQNEYIWWSVGKLMRPSCPEGGPGDC